MRCELLNAGSGRGIFHYFPENLRSHPVPPDPASLVDRAEHSTGRDVRPDSVQESKDLFTQKVNRNRTNIATLAFRGAQGEVWIPIFRLPVILMISFSVVAWY